jgi:hypothetical protein
MVTRRPPWLPRLLATDLTWFNASSKVYNVSIRLFSLFYRSPNSVDWHEPLWGVGVLQVGSRHLFYVGRDFSCRRSKKDYVATGFVLCALFVWLRQEPRF